MEKHGLSSGENRYFSTTSKAGTTPKARWPVSTVMGPLLGRGADDRIHDRLGGDVESIPLSILVDLFGRRGPDQVSSSAAGQDNFDEQGGFVWRCF